MNVKELKKLAAEWGAARRDVFGPSLSAAQNMHDAIMALPDDPQAEHEDLVKLALSVKVSFACDNEKSPHLRLASAVIERFGKHPRKVECWGVMLGDSFWHFFRDKNEAKEYIKKSEDKNLWMTRLTGTEEV